MFQSVYEMKLLTTILFSAMKVHYKTKNRRLQFLDILSSSKAIRSEVVKIKRLNSKKVSQILIGINQTVTSHCLHDN